MNAIELLQNQHRAVEQLFDRCAAASAVDKRTLFEQIADQLAIHAAIEEKLFYPACRTRTTAKLLDEAVREHFSMKELIAELIDLEGGSDAAFDVKLTQLKTAVLHHINDEEEPQLFPQVEQFLDNEVLEQLGDEMAELVARLEAEGLPRNQVFEELDAAQAPI